MRSRFLLLALAFGPLVLASASACSKDPPPPWTDEREACDDNDPLRQVYWGDLHVHTSWSFDAYVNLVRVDPEAALRFARGEAVQLPPLDADGQGTQTVQLERALDFAAITDHAEYLAEIQGCSVEGHVTYDSEFCVGYRDPEQANEFMSKFGFALGNSNPSRRDELCGEGLLDCEALASKTWLRMAEISEAAYDRTAACEFTSFTGYEWSGLDDLSNLHRNVLFRSSRVPNWPISHFEAPSPEQLWTALDEECNQGLDGCEALSIPHNGNWSNGKLFRSEYPEGGDEQWARLRAKIEPLVEVYQHKGDSECAPGPDGDAGDLLGGVLGAPDEACEFEKLRRPPYDDCADEVGSLGVINQGCVSKTDFLRGALLEGLQERERIGVNPFPVGVIASTDTHNGTPGMVSETDYPGHFGNREQGALERLTAPVPGGPRNSPGGLMAVWAEENSRDSLFDAMQRKETYGTSGPRIQVRFFGGWDLPAGLCDDPNLVERGYEHGVPMGGELGELERPDDAKPRFVVLAEQDVGTDANPGVPLDRVQLVKGWIDADGEAHLEVHDIAQAETPGSVDPLTCEPDGGGAPMLCAEFEDEDFGSERGAFWYVRVLESPVCRWSTTDCASLDDAERPDVCDELPTSIQERAWTSPIFF